MLWRRGKSYSQDLRERVFAAADDGERIGRIATKLRVSVSYVSKVLSRRALTGQTTARAQRCPRGSQTERPISGNPGARWPAVPMRRSPNCALGCLRPTRSRRAPD
jgi:hypothetical protein